MAEAVGVEYRAGVGVDVALAVKLQRIVLEQCREVPRNIGMSLAQEVAEHQEEMGVRRVCLYSVPPGEEE